MSKAAEGVIQTSTEAQTIQCSFLVTLTESESHKTSALKKGMKIEIMRKKKNSKRFVLYLIAPPLIMGGLQSQISIRHYIFYKNAIKYQSGHFITLLVKLLH